MHQNSYLEFQCFESLNSSGFFLVLEMNLKKSLFSGLFRNAGELGKVESGFTLCYKPLWALHHILPILCQTSEHLQHELLTSRNTRKSETTLLSFFNSILKYWVVTSPLKIFKGAEKTHRVLIPQISQNQNKHNTVHIYTYHENNVLSPWLSSYKNQT